MCNEVQGVLCHHSLFTMVSHNTAVGGNYLYHKFFESMGQFIHWHYFLFYCVQGGQYGGPSHCVDLFLLHKVSVCVW